MSSIWCTQITKGEVALYIGIIERCAGRDDTEALDRLKALRREAVNVTL